MQNYFDIQRIPVTMCLDLVSLKTKYIASSRETRHPVLYLNKTSPVLLVMEVLWFLELKRCGRIRLPFSQIYS